ncbi:MAG: hypothetical protein HY897_03010 [Deltaproteobacteria bacterium]|nr:hypothetical protein [Deltaproteobacteria bacterium]
MPKKVFTPAQVKKITGASQYREVPVPFFYTPPFLDGLRDWIQERLASSGGRPTLKGLEVVRKVRFSKRSWRELNDIARLWSRGGMPVSPSQVATSILDLTIHAFKEEQERKLAKERA